MLGTNLSYKEFIEEYKDENNKDKSVEIVNPNSNKVTEMTEEKFIEFIKDE